MDMQSSFARITCQLGSQSLVPLKAPMAFSSTQEGLNFSWKMCCFCFLKSTPVIETHTEEGFLSSEDQILTQLLNDSSRHYVMDHRANTYHTAASPPLALWWPEFPALLQKPLLSFILLKKETSRTELLRGDRMRKDHFSSPTIHRLETKWSSPSASFRGG